MSKEIESVKFSKALFYYALNTGFASISGFISNLIFARYFGMQIVGEYTLLLSFISIFFSIATFGILSGVGREATWYVANRKNMGNLLSLIYLVIFISAIILIIPFYTYAKFQLSTNYNAPHLILPLLLFTAIHLFFVIPSAILLTSFECHREILYPLVINIISGSSKIILLMFSIYFIRNIFTAIVINYFIPNILLIILLVVASVKILKLKISISHFRETSLHFKNVIGYSFRFLPVAFSELIIANTSYLIIGYYLKIESLGEYRVVFAIFTIFSTIPVLFGKILLPTLTKLFFNNELNRINNYFLISLKVSITILIPILATASVFSKEILALYGIYSTEAQISFIILLLANLVMSGSFVGSVLASYNKPAFVSLFLGIGALANLILSVILTPKFGIVGASVSSFFCYLITQIFVFRHAMKLMNALIPTKIIYIPISNGLIMIATMFISRYYFGLNSYLFIPFILGCVTYIGLTFYKNTFTVIDLSQFSTIINSINNDVIRYTLQKIILALKTN